MATITKDCENCKKPFQAERREVNRGNGKFCNKTCFKEWNRERCKNLPPPEPNVQCSQCQKTFYKNTSQKTNSKSGLFFCTRKCKDTAQQLGGIAVIMPPHYGTARADDHKHYRRIAFGVKPKVCERCSYSANEAAIIVHHKDRNRMNDDISNLEVLCCNCHAIEHWGEPDQTFGDD